VAPAEETSSAFWTRGPRRAFERAARRPSIVDFKRFPGAPEGSRRAASGEQEHRLRLRSTLQPNRRRSSYGRRRSGRPKESQAVAPSRRVRAARRPHRLQSTGARPRCAMRSSSRLIEQPGPRNDFRTRFETRSILRRRSSLSSRSAAKWRKRLTLAPGRNSTKRSMSLSGPILGGTTKERVLEDPRTVENPPQPIEIGGRPILAAAAFPGGRSRLKSRLRAELPALQPGFHH